MKQVVIENPVLNSPFEVPQRHFKFDDEGITNEIVESRRSSAYFIPIGAGPNTINDRSLPLLLARRLTRRRAQAFGVRRLAAAFPIAPASWRGPKREQAPALQSRRRHQGGIRL